jgi:hypothetical protein
MNAPSRPVGALLAAALTAAVSLAPRTARAEGYSARYFHVAADARGLGTIDGARAPDPGTGELSIASDYLRGPLLLTGSNGTQALLTGRWVLEPGITLGLPSGFALFARAPFAVMDSGIDRTNDLTPTGPFPPAFGGLVPLYRAPGTNARLSLRAEGTLPIGDASSFRGDDGMTARLSAVYGAPVLRSFALVSFGILFAPTRSTGTEQLGGTTATAGLAFRFPADAPTAAVVSTDWRVQTEGSHETTALGALGVDVRIGDATIRALAGAQTDFLADSPNLWFGLAWIQDARLAPAPVAPTAQRVGSTR